MNSIVLMLLFATKYNSKVTGPILLVLGAIFIVGGISAGLWVYRVPKSVVFRQLAEERGLRSVRVAFLAAGLLFLGIGLLLSFVL